MFQNNELLTSIIASKYPYIFIDEYQDTSEDTVISLIDYLLSRNKDNLILGFYGDSYQKIYDTGIGTIQKFVNEDKITLVTKLENYRSSEKVIGLLNNIRDNIKQEIPESKKTIKGTIEFINSVNYPNQIKGQNKTEYEKSLVPIKNENYDLIKSKLEKRGWNFGKNSDDKILIIVNSRVSKRGGFGELYQVYSRRFGQLANDKLLKRDHPLTALFVGTMDKNTSIEREIGIEHLVSFYENNDYGRVISFLKNNSETSVKLEVHKNKKEITDKLDELIQLRKNKTIKDVLDYVEKTGLIIFNKGAKKLLDKLKIDINEVKDEDEKTRIQKDTTFLNNLLSLPYNEIIRLFKHLQNENIFSTKHGTKGEEYRNVLVIIDDTSWKPKYNFEKFFDDTDDKQDRKLRTKNLFYVSCSRAKENLVVLALSKMGNSAMQTIEKWFGEENVTQIAYEEN